MKRKKANFILIVAVVIAVAASAEAIANMVPADYRYKLTLSSLSELQTYDSVARPAGSGVSRPWGNLYGDVVGVDWRLWFFDAGNEPPGWDSSTTPFVEGLQPIGYYDTNGGIDYNFQDSLFPPDYGLYGDSPVTNTIDEGAWEGDAITILAQRIGEPMGFYDAYFSSGSLMAGYTGTLGRNDITISGNLTSVVPVPPAVILGIFGLSVAGWKLRRKA